MSAINRILISCMDRRLSAFLDSEYNDEKTVFVRNAGANVLTVLNTVKQLSIEHPIKSIIIAPHTDCGAMGLVEAAINGKVKPSAQIDKYLVSQFKNNIFADRKELESRINCEVQAASLEQFARSIGAVLETRLIDLSTLDIPQDTGRHILTIAKPSPTMYSDLVGRYSDNVGMFESYFIQARSIRDVLPDIEIAATALHISDIRMISESKMNNEIMESDVKVLKSQDYLNSAKITALRK